MLSEEQIEKFQKLYLNSFGKEISRQDAVEQGVKLARLFQLVYKPITSDELRRLKKKRLLERHKTM